MQALADRVGCDAEYGGDLVVLEVLPATESEDLGVTLVELFGGLEDSLDLVVVGHVLFGRRSDGRRERSDAQAEPPPP